MPQKHSRRIIWLMKKFLPGKRLKLLADENIAAPLVRALREAGIDVAYIADNAPGITDDEVLEKARQGDRILLTEDKDFGELVFRLKRHVPGVILLRLPAPRQEQYRERLLAILKPHVTKFKGSYTVLEQNRVRFRPFPHDR